MSDDRKVRPEAVLKTLPPEQQQTVFNIIESTTYAAALKLLEEQLSLHTSQAALSMFRAWYLKRKLRKDMLDSVRIADVIDKQVDEAALDRAIAIKTKDLAWRALLAGHDKKAIKSLVDLSLDMRVEDRQDKKLERLLAAERQRDAALKQLAEVEKRVSDLLEQLNRRKQGAEEADPSKAMEALELFLGTKPKLQPAPTTSDQTPQSAPAEETPATPAPDVAKAAEALQGPVQVNG